MFFVRRPRPLHRLARIRARVALLLRDTRGVSAVEFGMIALPLCLTLTFALELGFHEFCAAQLNSATQAAVRDIMLGNSGVGTREDFKTNLLCSRLSGMLDCAKVVVQAQVLTSASQGLSYSGQTVDAQVLDLSNQTGRWCPGGPSDYVYVQVGYPVPVHFAITGTTGVIQVDGAQVRPAYSSAIVLNEPNVGLKACQ
jgi:Flp pilus assembly protein TadG